MAEWQNALLSDSASLTQAVNMLNEASLRIVLVVDENMRLLGTITDGDIRRGLMHHASMDDAVSTVMNNKPVTASVDQSREMVLTKMRESDILQVPIVDADGRVVKVEFLQELTQTREMENPVLLMAGGLGTRLRPLTRETPKPMLKVGDKPILETIVKQLVDSGFLNLFVSICYKAEVVRSYFGNGQAWGANIEYLEENEPLGTAGALSLLPESGDPFPVLLMNGDILTKVDFRRLVEYHDEQDAHLTMCVREYDFQVPYGVVSIEDQRVTSLREKPVHTFFVNAGIYIVGKEIISESKKTSAIDMPELINQQVVRGRNVNVFPIHEYWLDIGMIEQYETAQTDMGHPNS